MAVEIRNDISGERVRALGILAQAYAQAEHFAEAERVTAEIEGSTVQVRALEVLVQAYAEAERFAEAERAATRTENATMRAQILRQITETYAQAADLVDGDQRMKLLQALLHFVQRH